MMILPLCVHNFSGFMHRGWEMRMIMWILLLWRNDGLTRRLALVADQVLWMGLQVMVTRKRCWDFSLGILLCVSHLCRADDAGIVCVIFHLGAGYGDITQLEARDHCRGN